MKFKYRTPEQVRKLWIKNLTSGKYRHHNFGQFYYKGCHCALGVLQDMMYKDGREDLKLSPQTYSDNYTEVQTALSYMGLDKQVYHELYNKNDNSNSYEPVVEFIKKKFDTKGLSY